MTETAYEDCLLWGVSEAYFQQRGAQAWHTREVPYLIGANPQYALQLAQLLHASLRAAPPAGEIHVLELGAGHGVLSYFLLQAFDAICALEGSDFHQRLRYLITDNAPRCVAEIAAHPLLQRRLADGRVRVGRLNLNAPERWMSPDGRQHRLAPGSLSAVIANYVFDALPQTVYRLQAGQLSKKFVTLQPAGPPGPLPPHVFQLVDLLLVSRFAPWEPDQVEPPWLRARLRHWLAAGKIGLVPWSRDWETGLRALLERLRPQGLLWIADKGEIGPLPWPGVDFWPSLLGLSSAQTVNFPLLTAYARQVLGVWGEHSPLADQHLKTLVIQKARTPTPAVLACYRENFVRHNRNEIGYAQYRALAEAVLAGRGEPLA